MSQKIKKHIRKSMPVFMIFSLLISTSVAGLVFNLDFKIIETVNKHLGIEFSLSEAQAADTASTTVTVRNAAPNLVGNVAEVPVHASNTPVNVGEQAVWQATANDAESNDYFLIVCATDAVTASTSAGGAPSCDGGAGDTFCVSGATASGAQSTCTDASLADPGAESDAWYAYVCDNHATEAECSTANQGSGDSGSPIYINHAPVFSAIATSDDNKDPGGTFTVTASTVDNDTEGGSDEVYLSVCSSNSWATSTGCTADTWCTGTSTVNNVSCSFATTTPAVDGSYTYYAFIKDWHELEAVVHGRSTTYTVNNVAPTVSNVVINGGSIIEVNMKGDSESHASSTADLYDANSCLDLIDSTAVPVNRATSSLYLSTVADTLNCSADDNDCYQLTTTECAYVPGSCTGAGDTTASYTCSTTITHFAVPTDATASNPNAGADWRAGITAVDQDGLKGSAVSVSGVELISLEALGITETEIPYGSIRGGQDSGGDNATTTVVNFGNIPIDTEIEGTSMDKSDLTDVITESNQEFDLLNFTYGVGTYTLSSTTPATVDTVTAKPTSSADVSDQIFWGINIPGGTSSGDYAGTNTFTAKLDSSDW